MKSEILIMWNAIFIFCLRGNYNLKFFVNFIFYNVYNCLTYTVFESPGNDVFIKNPTIKSTKHTFGGFLKDRENICFLYKLSKLFLMVYLLIFFITFEKKLWNFTLPLNKIFVFLDIQNNSVIKLWKQNAIFVSNL